MELSIIIPVYNSSKYLTRCIESILNQSFEDYEAIFVNDGSTDNSIDILEDYARKDSRIKIINKENGGQTSARYAGVEKSAGKYIGFVDSDDYIDTLMFERLYSSAEDYDCDFVSSGIIREYEDGQQIYVFDNYAEGFYDDFEKEIYPTLLYNFEVNDFGIYCTLVNKLYKRELILEVLKELDREIIYGEDAATFYKYCMSCKSAYILREAYYHYCIRKESISSSANLRITNNNYKLFESLKNDFQKSLCSNELMHQLKRYIMNVESHYWELFYDINPGVLNRWEFDVSDTAINSRFILYGAGGCGQAFYHYIRKEGKGNNMVAWVDRDYARLKSQCDYPLSSIKKGIQLEYDYILVAIKNNKTCQTIKETLIKSYGVFSEKIIAIDAKEYLYFSEALY